MHRELQNTRQNAAVGVWNLRRGLQCKKNSRGFKTLKVYSNVNDIHDLYKRRREVVIQMYKKLVFMKKTIQCLGIFEFSNFIKNV